MQARLSQTSKGRSLPALRMLARLRGLLSHICTFLLLWSCILMSYQVAIADNGNGGGSGESATTAMHLDLGSTEASISGSGVIESAVTIDVGGTSKTVDSSSMLTAAEYVAALQVASGGTQSLQLHETGTAVGGSFVASTLGSLTGLIVPTGVTAIHDFASGSTFNLTGDLVNSGTLFAVSSSPSVTNATFSANNIINQSGALLTSVLPTNGLSGFSNLVSNLNLTLNAVSSIFNYGTISSAGNLNLVAGTSIVNGVSPANATSSAVSAATASIQATNAVTMLANTITNQGQIASLLNNVNLQTNNLTNAGLLQAAQGSINVEALLGNTINVLNTDGIMAARDSIAFNLPNSASNIINLTGGSLSANSILLDATLGTVNLSVENISNAVAVDGRTVNISVSSGTNGLTLEGLPQASAGSLSYTGLGDVSFRTFETNGGSVAVSTTGNITVRGPGNSPNPGDIDARAISGPAGNVSLISTEGSVSTGNIWAANITLTGRNEVSVVGDLSAPGGTLTIGGSSTNVSGNVDIGSGTVNWSLPSTNQYLVNFEDLVKFGGSSITLGNQTGYSGDIIVTQDCLACLGNISSFTVNTNGQYIATGTTMTLGDAAFSVSANGGISTGSVSAGSIAFGTNGLLTVDGNLTANGAVTLSGGDIMVQQNQSLIANGGNLWLNATNDITVSSGATLASYATADGATGGRIGLMSGAPTTNMNALLAQLANDRTGAEMISLPAGAAWDQTSNVINSSGGSVLQAIFPSFATKSVSNSTFNLEGGVIFLDPPGTNNVIIDGANFIAVGPQMTPVNTGGGNAGGGNTGGGNTGGGTAAGTGTIIDTTVGTAAGNLSGAAVADALSSVTSSLTNATISSLSTFTSTANGTASTSTTANTNTAQLSLTRPALPTQPGITDTDGDRHPMRAAIYCSPPGKLSQSDSLTDDSWIIAANKCQPFSFETADGSIIIGTGPAIFAPSNDRTLLLKEGKLLVIAGEGMIVVRTPMCNVTIPVNSAATVEFSPSGLTRVTGLAGGKASCSVTRQGETIILTAAAGEQLILAEDVVPESEIQCVPDVPNKKNISWLVRLAGLRGEKFSFDRAEMVAREGLLNCTLGCFTKLQQTMIDQIRKSMMSETTKELKSMIPARSRTLISKARGGNHFAAVGFGQILDLTTADVIAMKSASANVRYSAGANIEIAGANRLNLKSGDALVSTNAATTIAAGRYTVHMQPHAIALISNRGDHLTVRNLYESKQTSLTISTDDQRHLGTQLGHELIIGKQTMSHTQVLNEEPVGRRRMRHNDLGKTHSVVSSEVSIVSLLQNTNLLSQLQRSQHPDDKAMLNKIMKMAVSLQLVTQKHGNYSIISR